MNKHLEIKDLETPFTVKLGFDKLIEKMEETIKNDTGLEGELNSKVLAKLKHKEVLRNGFEDEDSLDLYKEDISNLLSILFPSPLLSNEIKIAVSPNSDEILKSTGRFRNVFGDISKLTPKEFESNDLDRAYIYMCCYILGFYYGRPIISRVPPIYNVTDNRNITKYYKSGFNTDFITLKPITKAPEVTDEVIDHLKSNFEDIGIWKKLFPPASWEVKGFAIKSFTNVSNDHALSLIKNDLIGSKAKRNQAEFIDKMNSHVSTLLDVPDVKTSFILYDEDKSEFFKPNSKDKSFALELDQAKKKEDLLCPVGLHQIFNIKQHFIVHNIGVLPEKAFEISIYRSLRKNGVKSYIMTPLYYEEQLLGVLEFSSNISGSLDITHSYRIERLKELSTLAIKQFLDEKDDQISSIIQHEFTSIHSSVEWKFREEAEKALMARLDGIQYNFDNIKFRNLTALYGQMDIAGSSVARNKAIATDLKDQLKLVRNIIDSMSRIVQMPFLDKIKYQSAILGEKLNSDLVAGMEQELTDFFQLKINPLFRQMSFRGDEFDEVISSYFEELEPEMGVIYNKRKDYDTTVKLINMHLSGRLDEEQERAQEIFPHFFERYKTDGVEHNMFIGAELCPKYTFNNIYLENLRLWQLQTICQLEIEYKNKLQELPIPLKVASLIMVYSNSLAIRYRMDEKQFDIDGAYNARYEIIKKRIDKAHIKGSKERITQPGKIVIIYTQAQDLDEYLEYVNFLIYEGYLQEKPETFDIEDLQGVVGLKGLRVAVNFGRNDNLKTKKQVNTKAKLATSQVLE